MPISRWNGVSQIFEFDEKRAITLAAIALFNPVAGVKAGSYSSKVYE